MEASVYKCSDAEAGLAVLSAEQVELQWLLADVRDALELRGQVLRGALAMAITLGRAEKRLASILGEPSVADGAGL